MVSKEAFRLIVNATSLQTGMNQEEMALDMGYGKNYISEILSPTGKVTAKFIKAFQSHFNGLENPKPAKGPESLLELLMQQMTNLMQTQNNLLRDQKEQVVDKVKEVDINLKRALQGVSKLVLHVESARVVVLDSLSRLEKKSPGSLRKEADKIMDQLEGQQLTHGTSADGGN